MTTQASIPASGKAKARPPKKNLSQANLQGLLVVSLFIVGLLTIGATGGLVWLRTLQLPEEVTLTDPLQAALATQPKVPQLNLNRSYNRVGEVVEVNPENLGKENPFQ